MPDCMKMLGHVRTKLQVTNMPTWVGPKCVSITSWSKNHYQSIPILTVTVLDLGVSYPDFRVINEGHSFQNLTSHGILIILEETCQQFCKLVHKRSSRNLGQNPNDSLDQIISRTLTADQGYGTEIAERIVMI
jgi:hypothetical protein